MTAQDPPFVWNGQPFGGTKVALFCKDALLVYLRDDTPQIPFPGLWDLPGGGREGDEDPVSCGLRELEEEFGLRLPAATITYVRRYAAERPEGPDTYFCAGDIGAADVSEIIFRDEGQRWELMGAADFMRHERAIKHLAARLAEHLVWRAKPRA